MVHALPDDIQHCQVKPALNTLLNPIALLIRVLHHLTQTLSAASVCVINVCYTEGREQILFLERRKISANRTAKNIYL